MGALTTPHQTSANRGRLGTARGDLASQPEPTRLRDPNNNVFTAAYDAVGRRTTLLDSSGLTRTYEYDPTGSLTTQIDWNGANPIVTFVDGYDEVGNRTSRVKDGVASTWVYDSIYRLTAQQKSGQAASFIYDDGGNITVKHHEGSNPVTFSYDAGNRLTTSIQGASQLTTFSHDANGNMIGERCDALGTLLTWTYDNENRCLNELRPSGANHTYTYQSDGLRWSAHHGGSPHVNSYIWDGQDLINEYIDGGLNARLAVLDGEVLARRQGGTRYVFVPDPLGSIHHLLDSSLNKAATMVYRPYGELQSLTGVEWPMQFVGALGYYTAVANRAYVRARWLRPDLGRWQTVDPMGRASRRAYDYARNAPTQLVDPSGAWPCRTSNCCRDEHDFWESGWPAHACRGPWVECPKRATLNSCLRVMWSRADCSRLESIIREVAGICETMCTGGTYGGGTRLTGAVHCCQETDGTTRFCSMKCCSDDKLMRLWPSDKVARCALSCLIDHEQYHALECIVGSLPLSECCAYAEQVNCLLGVYRRVCATSVVPEGAASGCLAMAAYLEGCPSGVLPW